MTLQSLREMPLRRLVEMFEMTETMEDPNVYTVRGWLVDAIQEKCPIGVSAWLESECPDDKDLRKFVLNGGVTDCTWAVCYRIDEKTQDDGKEKEQITALFSYPFQAEDFIERCLPKENRDRFYVRHIWREPGHVS